MLIPAFSTVACPELTLREVSERARAWGFEAVELRTFGVDSTRFACDPALTDPDKARRLFHGAGVEVASLATGVSFEEPVRPPVIGHLISDTERAVRAGKQAIDLAVSLECPLVRVFGFVVPPRERRASAVARIVDRLGKVVDHADRSGVRVMLENGGSFADVAGVLEIVRRIGSNLLGVCYSPAALPAAGLALEEPRGAVSALGRQLFAARVKDLKGVRACMIGDGGLPCSTLVMALAEAKFRGPVIVEWDRAWMPDLEPAEQVLPEACRRIWSWASVTAARPASPGAVSAGARR